MKTYSQDKPEKNFHIENIENGKCTILFFDNIKSEQDEDGNITYNYDLYTLKLISRANLEQQIKDNYSKWLNLAKETEYNKLAEEVRAKRDKLLADTDWTQVTDSALTKEKQEKYKEYRQKLRDITKQEEFPYNIDFPSIPNE